MATPFSKALEEVTRGYEDADDSSPPSFKCLNVVLQSMANQMNKTKAINEGLLVMLIPLYRAYLEHREGGTAWTHSDLALYEDSEYPHFKNTDNDVTFQCRLTIMRLLRSCILFLHGREKFSPLYSLESVLECLNDPCSIVRSEALRFISQMLTFEDTTQEIYVTLDSGRQIYSLLLEKCFILLNDSEYIVQFRSLELLSLLTSQIMPLWDDNNTNVDTTQDEYKNTTVIPLIISNTLIISKALVRTELAQHTPNESYELRMMSVLSKQQYIIHACSVLTNIISDLSQIPIANPIENKVTHQQSSVELCATLLTNPHFPLVRSACQLLLHTTTSIHGIKAVSYSDKCVSRLCNIVDGDTHQATSSASVKEVAILVLHNIAALEDGLRCISSYLLHSPNCLFKVLGAKSSVPLVGLTLSSYLSTHTYVCKKQGLSGVSSDSDENTLVLSQVLTELPLLLPSLKLLEVILFNGGALQAWGIAGVVTILDSIVRQTPTNDTSFQDVVNVTTIATKCLSYLCRDNRDARVALESLKLQQQQQANSGKKEGKVFDPSCKPDGLWPM